jgi:ADP-heptose:LPS heptosyltransferase
MHILLARPDGIGDQISCLPVATALRQLMPEARISFLSSPYAAPVLENHPDVDEVFTGTSRDPLRELIQLFKGGFDAVVFLKPFRRLMLAAFLAQVPVRVATGYRWYSFLANKRVYEHRHDYSKHETEYNLGLLKGLGLVPRTSNIPRLVLTEEEKKLAGERLQALPVKRVLVHPGGFDARRWHSQHYMKVAKRLAAEGCGVVLTGNEQERQRFCEEASVTEKDIEDPNILNLMGRISLRELMAVIGAANIVVSGSTGPAHLAAGLGVSTVSLFDPRRNQSPTRWKPLGKGVILLPEVPTCEKCIHEACPFWDCLDRISVDVVLERVRQFLEEKTPPLTLSIVEEGCR